MCVWFRLGGSTQDYVDVKNHAFFSSINFDELMAKKVRSVVMASATAGKDEIEVSVPK